MLLTFAERAGAAPRVRRPSFFPPSPCRFGRRSKAHPGSRGANFNAARASEGASGPVQGSVQVPLASWLQPGKGRACLIQSVGSPGVYLSSNFHSTSIAYQSVSP